MRRTRQANTSALSSRTLRGTLTAPSSTFVFNQPSDIQWRCAVFGQGAIVKRTAATVELLSNTQTDLYAKQYNGFSAYCTWGGLTVESGTLKLPQDNVAATYSFGPVMMSEGATLFLLHSRWMPVSPGASGMQPRDPFRPWRGTLASGHKPSPVAPLCM